jgi:hypothetical protein
MKDNEMNEELEGNKILRDQLKFYQQKDVMVHIKKKNGKFYNGLVLEIAGDMVIINDRKIGGVPIHFIEIEILEKFTDGGDGSWKSL